MGEVRFPGYACMLYVEFVSILGVQICKTFAVGNSMFLLVHI